MGQLGPLRAGLFLGVRGLWRGLRGKEEGHLTDPWGAGRGECWGGLHGFPPK